MKNLLKIMFAAFLCTSVCFAASQKGTMKDPRDGTKYKTVMQNYGRKEKGGYYKYEGFYAGFHSSTGAGSEDAFGMHLGSDSDDADLGISNILNGFSVCCLKD